MPVLARHKGDPISGEKKKKNEAPTITVLITPELLHIVMSNTGTNQEQATAALIKHDGDVFNAIIELTI